MKNISLLFLMLFFQQCNNKSETTASNPLIGTWRLIEFTDKDTVTGQWGYRYGKNPRGYFTYTKSNIVNLNISTDAPLKISEEDSKKHMVNLYDYVMQVAIGYFGTYTLDAEKSIVTHHVKGGGLPWYIDTDQPRQFQMKGDTLIIGDNIKTRRVLVRVD